MAFSWHVSLNTSSKPIDWWFGFGNHPKTAWWHWRCQRFQMFNHIWGRAGSTKKQILWPIFFKLVICYMSFWKSVVKIQYRPRKAGNMVPSLELWFILVCLYTELSLSLVSDRCDCVLFRELFSLQLHLHPKYPKSYSELFAPSSSKYIHGISISSRITDDLPSKHLNTSIDRASLCRAA